MRKRVPAGEARKLRALCSVADTASADRLAAAAGVPLRRLMDNAGRALAHLVSEHYPDGPVTVLCGPGNNGGDGYVAARRLRMQGRAVRVVALAQPATPLAQQAADHWQGACATAATLGLDAVPDLAAGPGVLVDALFGAGLTRPLEGAAAALAEACAAASRAVVSADLPSGIDGDSGGCLGVAYRARFTVAFERARVGHFLGEGARHCGTVKVVPIGIPAAVWEQIPAAVKLWHNHPQCWSGTVGKHDPWKHKYTYGHALVRGGPPGRGGAARLAAGAALRAGAGAATLAVAQAAQGENAARLGAVMVREAEDASGLRTLLEGGRFNAVLLGPGGGADQAMRDAVGAILDAPGYRDGSWRVVLDADALTAFAEHPEPLFAALQQGTALLTPHAGEFARMFPDLGQQLQRGQASPVELARAASERANAAVLLKGGCTIIARAGAVCLNAATGSQAAPWLATAGAGDVLAGLATGFLARGFDAMEAAAAAAWVHAQAARDFGPGLTADDLGGAIPRAMARAVALQESGSGLRSPG